MPYYNYGRCSLLPLPIAQCLGGRDAVAAEAIEHMAESALHGIATWPEIKADLSETGLFENAACVQHTHSSAGVWEA